MSASVTAAITTPGAPTTRAAPGAVRPGEIGSAQRNQ